MKNLLKPMVPASLVQVATGGYCTPAVQRNWVARGLFALPLLEPRAGKPRIFSLISTYEAALLSWAAESNFPLEMVKRAFLWRKRQLACVRRGGWLEPDFQAAVAQGHFREFESRSDDDPAYWVLAVTKDFWTPDLEGEDESPLPRDFRGVLVAEAGGLAEAITRFDGPVLLINITRIVNAADRALEAAGWKPDDGGAA